MSRIGKRFLKSCRCYYYSCRRQYCNSKRPKGELTRTFNADMLIKIEENTLTVERPSEQKEHRALHGTTRALIGNMVEGVTEGFARGLELVGVGYRAQKQGDKLVLSVGYSHPVEMTPEAGLEVEVPAPTKIVIKGIDKQRVGNSLLTSVLYVL